MPDIATNCPSRGQCTHGSGYGKIHPNAHTKHKIHTANVNYQFTPMEAPSPASAMMKVQQQICSSSIYVSYSSTPRHKSIHQTQVETAGRQVK